LMSPFTKIPLGPELLRVDWVNHPQQFTEQLTAYSWSQHQIDAYHKTALEYQQAPAEGTGRDASCCSALDDRRHRARHGSDRSAAVSPSDAAWDFVYTD
jgi:hypothetical protein